MGIATPTVLDTVTQSTTAAAITSNSFSPAANAFLIVCATAAINTTTLPAPITDTFSPNLSWTQYTVEQGSGVRSTVVVSVAQTGASPGGGTVTTTFANAAINRRVQHVVQVASGFNTSTPVRQTKTGTGTTAATVTLDSTPLTDSLVLGVLALNGSSTPRAVPNANFTELVETGAGVNRAQNVQYDQDNTTTTVDWTNQSGAWSETGVVALEIAAATSGRVLSPRRMDGLGIFYRGMDS